MKDRYQVPQADLRSRREPVGLGNYILDRLFNPKSWLSGRGTYADGAEFSPLREGAVSDLWRNLREWGRP